MHPPVRYLRAPHGLRPNASARNGGPSRHRAPPTDLVLDRLAIGGFPTAPLPVFHPAGNAVTDVGGIGIQIHLTFLIQCLKRANRRRQLHAIIGRFWLTPPEFLLHTAVSQQHPPAAGARIPAAGTIGIDFDGFSRHWPRIRHATFLVEGSARPTTAGRRRRSIGPTGTIRNTRLRACRT